jgi:hypothetical protein
MLSAHTAPDLVGNGWRNVAITLIDRFPRGSLSLEYGFDATFQGVEGCGNGKGALLTRLW